MTLRAAIAGAGLMGYWHARALSHAGAKVAGVFDLNLAAAQQLARRFSGARASTDLSVLLSEEKVDVLHICTPTGSHSELARQAIERGVHVLVEKPLAVDAGETRGLYELAAKHEVQLCPVHQFAFQQGVLETQSKLGALGRLLHFRAQFCSAGGAGKSGEVLDSIVADILPHPLSLMASLAPGSVEDAEWSVQHPSAGEFQCVASVEGTVFSVLVSMNARPTSTTLHLLGTQGSAHIDLFHGFVVFEPGDVSRWRKIIHPFDLSVRTLLRASSNLAGRALRSESAYPGLRGLIARFYNALADRGPIPISRDNALLVAQVRDRLIDAARLNPRVATRMPS